MNLLLVFVFVFGAMIGSFLNVLIVRLPENQDFIFKRSHCRYCNALIPWYENIPLVSYLFLRGKCSTCARKISLQYPLVELFMAVISVYIFPRNLDLTGFYNYFFYLSIVSVFLVHFVVDLKHRILPDQLNIYLFLLFLLHSIFYQKVGFWISGLLIGLFFPLTVAYIFYKLKGVEGLGGGDIKLYAVLGLLLGPLGIIQTIFFSCFLGSIIGLIMILMKKIDRNYAIPFGPAVILVASAQIFTPHLFEKLTKTFVF